MNPISIGDIAKGIGGALAFWRRPRLSIEAFVPSRDVSNWTIAHAPLPALVYRVFNLQVRNDGRTPARRAIARLKFVKAPKEEFRVALPFVLHWADTPYSQSTSAPDPVDIGPEGRRLDVIFTDANQNIEGCWVATPFALGRPALHQFYLPPGQYEAIVTVHAENAANAAMRFQFTSPQRWDELAVAPLSLIAAAV